MRDRDGWIPNGGHECPPFSLPSPLPAQNEIIDYKLLVISLNEKKEKKRIHTMRINLRLFEMIHGICNKHVNFVGLPLGVF